MDDDDWANSAEMDALMAAAEAEAAAAAHRIYQASTSGAQGHVGLR